MSSLSEFTAAREVDRRLRAMLRGYGLRSTAQRIAVLHVFAVADDSNAAGQRVHLTAAQVHERLAAAGGAVDLTTVYRTLTTLVNLGVLHATAHGDQASTYGLTTGTPHHAVCTGCGAVTEIPAAVLAPALQAVYEATGYRADAASVSVNALCPDCQRQ